MSDPKHGFTLIEAVVAAVIVVVLIVVFWPVYPMRGGEPAHRVACLSNVKQLSTGLLLYEADHHDRLPPARAWMDATRQYTKNPDLYRCPIVARSGSPSAHGYAFNRNLSSLKTATIKRPERAVTLYDSSDLRRNATDLLTSLPRPGRHPRGRSRSNVLAYADGHAKSIPDPL